MPGQLTKEQKAIIEVKPKVKEQHDRILERAPRLYQDIIQFYFDVHDFRTTVIAGVPKWKIYGYMSRDYFDKAVWEAANQKRATFYQYVRMVEELPPATIKRLGKTKSMMAARLKRKRKLTPELEGKLEKAKVEEAERITKKVLNKTEENRVLFKLMLKESQWNALEEQLARIRNAAGAEGIENGLDVLLAFLMHTSDEQLFEICKG